MHPNRTVAIANDYMMLTEPNGQCFGNPNPYNLSKKYGSTPPICTAVRPPFVSPCFPGFQASKKGKPCNTPPICTAVRLPFVRQHAPHLYGSTFGKILGVRVTGTFLTKSPELLQHQLVLGLDIAAPNHKSLAICIAP